MPRPVLASAAALGACVVLIAVAWTASTGVGPLASGERPVHFPALSPSASSQATPGATPTVPKPPPPTTGDGPDLTWVGRTVEIVSLLALVSLIGSLVWIGLSGRFSRRIRKRRERVRFEVSPEAFALGEELAAARETHLTRLSEGSPRNGIVQSWMAFEDAATAVGLPPRLAETATEFLTRILNQLQISPEPGVRLAQLYHVARFSSHELSEADRSAARQALLDLHRQLAARPGAGRTEART